MGRGAMNKRSHGGTWIFSFQFSHFELFMNCMFELQPTVHSSSGATSMLSGMDRRYDEHIWTPTKTTNIRNTNLIQFCYVHCVGHLRWRNSSCFHVRNHGHPNETSWDGVSANPVVVGSLEEQRISIICSNYKLRLECIHTCSCQNVVFGPE